MLTRSLKTLKIRMETHCYNTECLVEVLKTHKFVEKIYYPGLESFPNYEVAKQ